VAGSCGNECSTSGVSLLTNIIFHVHNWFSISTQKTLVTQLMHNRFIIVNCIGSWDTSKETWTFLNIYQSLSNYFFPQAPRLAQVLGFSYIPKNNFYKVDKLKNSPALITYFMVFCFWEEFNFKLKFLLSCKAIKLVSLKYLPSSCLYYKIMEVRERGGHPWKESFVLSMPKTVIAEVQWSFH